VALRLCGSVLKAAGWNWLDGGEPYDDVAAGVIADAC
jgi:hypothetical protein